MKKNVLHLGVLGALVSSSLMAGTMGAPVDTWSQVMSLSLGPVWPTTGDSQTFYLTSAIEKTYTVNNNNDTLLDGEFFYGGQHRIDSRYLGQIGLAVAGTTNAKIAGEIWDDADPAFNNLAYSYKVNHAHIALKGKLLADMGYMVLPYLSGSLGIGFNHAHDFTNSPLIFEAIPNPNYKSRTQTAFTYTVGVGIQKPFNENWQVGVGYEFADWGKVRLGKAPGQTINQGLSQSHLYTNGLLFNITYVA